MLLYADDACFLVAKTAADLQSQLGALKEFCEYKTHDCQHAESPDIVL